MKARRWFLASIVAGTPVVLVLAACATDASGPYVEPDASHVAVSTPPDGDADAMAEAEARPCADCEYFPDPCSDGVLCPSGPFDPSTPGGGLDGRAQLNVIRGRSASDVWAVGALGALAHFDGTSWTRADLGADQTLLALWLRGSSEIALGDLRTVFARGVETLDAGADAAPPSSGGWTVYQGPLGPFDLLTILTRFASAWGAPDGEWLWCALTAISPGFSEGLWRVRVSPSSGTFELRDALPPGTCGSIPCSQMTSVFGISANDLWAVGLTGSTVHITDAESDVPKFRAFNTQTWNALRGVWAASESEAWSVGVQGTVRRYRGDPVLWDVVDVPTSANLNAVWGTSSSDVWAVGDGAVVVHYDGTSWTRVKVAGLGGRRPNLTTVWASAPGHVWIGGQGVMLSLGGKP